MSDHSIEPQDLPDAAYWLRVFQEIGKTDDPDGIRARIHGYVMNHVAYGREWEHRPQERYYYGPLAGLSPTQRAVRLTQGAAWWIVALDVSIERDAARRAVQRSKAHLREQRSRATGADLDAAEAWEHAAWRSPQGAQEEPANA